MCMIVIELHIELHDNESNIGTTQIIFSLSIPGMPHGYWLISDVLIVLNFLCKLSMLGLVWKVKS